MDLKTAKQKYSAQRGYTKGRVDKLGVPIEFRLTFQEWYDWWIQTGHIDERGSRRGQYVMARKNDIGHYELGNIDCKLTSDNNSESSKGMKRSKEFCENLSKVKTGKPRPQSVLDKLTPFKPGNVPWNKGKETGKKGSKNPEHSIRMKALWAERREAKNA